MALECQLEVWQQNLLIQSYSSPSLLFKEICLNSRNYPKEIAPIECKSLQILHRSPLREALYLSLFTVTHLLLITLTAAPISCPRKPVMGVERAFATTHLSSYLSPTLPQPSPCARLPTHFGQESLVTGWGLDYTTVQALNI